MLDVNRVVREILETIDGVMVTFQRPDKFNKLPAISYYELITTTGMRFDNAEQAQKSSAQIDIWAKKGGTCSRLAVEVDTAMQNGGWYRELSRDMPPEDGVCHKTMRFYKEIFFEEE